MPKFAVMSRTPDTRQVVSKTFEATDPDHAVQLAKEDIVHIIADSFRNEAAQDGQHRHGHQAPLDMKAIREEVDELFELVKVWEIK